MKTSRRNFLRAGAVGTAAVVAGPAAFAGLDPKPDDAVKCRTGPHGEGLPITMAGYNYSRVRALVEGQVTVEGCSTRFEVTSIGPLNTHAFNGPRTREVTEIGLIPYMLAYCNDGFREYALLPIFPLRLFRHKSIFVRKDAGIKRPADLRGRKVATVGYSSSGLTHVRGILQEEYGVKPEQIQWIATQADSASNLTGGVSSWEKLRPEGVSITDGPAGVDESGLLLSGQVDAIFHPAEPKAYQERHPLVDRLFTDHRTVERKYFAKTGIFPIMHAVAIRRDTAKAHPWLPKAVFEAYSKAKALDYEFMRRWGWALDSLPWYGQEFNETRALMGENFYPYGVQASRPALKAAFRFAHDQGLTERLLSLEEMFEESTLELEETT